MIDNDKITKSVICTYFSIFPYFDVYFIFFCCNYILLYHLYHTKNHNEPIVAPSAEDTSPPAARNYPMRCRSTSSPSHAWHGAAAPVGRSDTGVTTGWTEGKLWEIAWGELRWEGAIRE
jgi:hypothetical protein